MIYQNIAVSLPQADCTTDIADEPIRTGIGEDALKRAAAAKVGCGVDEITAVRVDKKSIDARHGKIKINLKCTVFCGEEPASEALFVPAWKKADGKNGKRVLIIGAGPAGLFAALRLLEAGIQPVIIERGKSAGERMLDIQKIDEGTAFDAHSNYCFGAGGAGAFSDGKLYTRSNKRGNVQKILQILCAFGADPKILTDAHPHIGSDKLPALITAITALITELGGEIFFSHFCESFELAPISAAAEFAQQTRVDKDVKLRSLTIVDTASGEKKQLSCDAVILACGHSSYETYAMLEELSTECGIALLESKTFAVGVRIEHPRAVIDSSQYKTAAAGMSAAEYALKTQIDGRGVYSFCMCPGGRVVMSASENGKTCVNGISLAERNSLWSNAAIVCEVRPEDVLSEDVLLKDALHENATAENAARFLLDFRKKLESDFFRCASEHNKNRSKNHTENSLALPAQRLTDFLAGALSKTLPPTSYSAGVFSARIDLLLPHFIATRLKKACAEFEKKMRTFIHPEALVIGIETGTSSAVRIVRDNLHESIGIAGLFPAGEGAGYAGGIISSALDGEKTADCIINTFYATI